MQQLTLKIQLPADIVTQVHERQRHPAGAPAEPAHCPALVRFHLSVLLPGAAAEPDSQPARTRDRSPAVPDPPGYPARGRRGGTARRAHVPGARTGGRPDRAVAELAAAASRHANGLAAAGRVRRHRPDASEEFNRALFAAHFELSEDLGDTAVIMRHASEAGIDTKVLRSALADGCAQAVVAETESAGARFGVQAPPTRLIAGKWSRACGRNQSSRPWRGRRAEGAVTLAGAEASSPSPGVPGAPAGTCRQRAAARCSSRRSGRRSGCRPSAGGEPRSSGSPSRVN